MNNRERYAALRGSFHAEPEMLARSLEARGLYACGLSYCAAWLTDGKIPVGVVTGWFGPMDESNRLRYSNVTAELTTKLPQERRPLWVERNGYFHVVAYLDHNPSRAEIENKNSKNAAKQAKYRERNTYGK